MYILYDIVNIYIYIYIYSYTKVKHLDYCTCPPCLIVDPKSLWGDSGSKPSRPRPPIFTVHTLIMSSFKRQKDGGSENGTYGDVVSCWLICKFWGYPTFKTYLISESMSRAGRYRHWLPPLGPFAGLPQEHRTIRAEEVQCHHQGHNGNHLLSFWVWHSLYSTRVCHILSRFWPEICEHV